MGPVPSLALSHSASSSHEDLHICLRDADGVQDADGRQLSLGAERINGRRAHLDLPRDLSYAKQIFLDPSWTRRFVVLR